MAGGTYAKQNLNFYNLSFLVSLNLPWKSEPQWVKLKDSGEATPQYVPKAPLSAEPQKLLPKPVGVLLSLIFFVPRIRSMKTVSTRQVFSRFSSKS